MMMMDMVLFLIHDIYLFDFLFCPDPKGNQKIIKLKKGLNKKGLAHVQALYINILIIYKIIYSLPIPA